MIAYPIGHPIGSHRVFPNRPRIARIESARVGSSSTGVLSSVVVSGYDSIHRYCRNATTARSEWMEKR